MIIVTFFSVVCTLKCMSRQLIQRIKAMLLCIVYAMLFVNSVDIYRENFWGGPLCCCMQDAASIDSVYIPWIL